MRLTLCLLTLAAATLAVPVLAQEPKTVDAVCIYAMDGADHLSKRADVAASAVPDLAAHNRITEAKALAGLIVDYRALIKKLRHDACMSSTLAEAKAAVERDGDECHRADTAIETFIDHVRAEEMRKGLK